MKTFREIAICVVVGVGIICFIGLWLYSWSEVSKNDTLAARVFDFENQTVREQVMRIQRQVGCKKVDGIIGTESTPLINAQSRLDEWEICQQEAARWNFM